MLQMDEQVQRSMSRPTIRSQGSVTPTEAIASAVLLLRGLATALHLLPAISQTSNPLIRFRGVFLSYLRVPVVPVNNRTASSMNVPRIWCLRTGKMHTLRPSTATAFLKLAWIPRRIVCRKLSSCLVSTRCRGRYMRSRWREYFLLRV